MSTTITISLCLITKNEEHCLTRCLESVRHLVDEIIIVDTGSTDATVDIATGHGALVFYFHWTDDFAAARNYAISKAQGQWILVLDADEVLAPLSRHELISYMAQSPAEGYYFRIISYLADSNKTVTDYVVRLFKNKPVYRFSGSIHEQVAGSIQSHNSDNKLILAPYPIYHYGYLEQELAKKHKFERNTAIIQKALQKNPLDPFLHYSLAVEYLQRKDFGQAGLLLEKTLTLLHGVEGYIPQVLTALLVTKLAAPDEHSETLFCRALQALPEQGDLDCLYGVWLMQHNQIPEAIEVLEAALSKKFDLIAPGQLQCCLGDGYFQAGLIVEAAECYLAALSETTLGLYPLTRLLTLWCNRDYIQLCKPVLSRFTPGTTRDLLQRAQHAGQSDLAIAVILLTVFESINANDLPRIVSACSTYVQYLATTSPPQWVYPEVFPLLKQGGEQLLLQSRLLELSGGHAANAQQALLADTLQNLLLISTVAQHSYPTDPLTFWEGVFIGETRFDCQPN
ncbi:glycosyltransferase family 2 protein [Sporomusa sp.]|uniref:glycosyltransferase family 2 protein n=1 Tax=Sporomusa sp. TaxID=2078658 RepID=UPI002C679E9A|nr:glycosyltransferase [Sporomusa sp.]HWR09086.1 glycosyltransferase [Sporomusa sp.]